ncbi:heat shock protein beta-6 [Amia ocellicauda]|uniref:heat shock protein beta-6 n=1 Tax=Amia ocellicauda TaxID=2972642 RepID=UPI0034645FB8
MHFISLRPQAAADPRSFSCLLLSTRDSELPAELNSHLEDKRRWTLLHTRKGAMDWDLPPPLPRLPGTHSCSPSELRIPPTEPCGGAQVSARPGAFCVRVDVQHFRPEQLAVRVAGGFVEVRGQHEQRQDGPGLVSRQFNRRYRVPVGVDVAALSSVLSPEGVLLITAPALPPPPAVDTLTH